ncbi:hypothetical protein [Nocardioides sp. TF02-7]|uniref:hypothetical protein n=1 Tax=Nocardioides sp. TF02-7 TaxID=2917724 RepID=UPI001F06CAE5|nr:hypothetical protein [Nocardioides sp. TF02-7]UMG93612.1 hypothetical protein MF408_05320 [Nocardioides sp. TF02-7]
MSTNSSTLSSVGDRPALVDARDQQVVTGRGGRRGHVVGDPVGEVGREQAAYRRRGEGQAGVRLQDLAAAVVDPGQPSVAELVREVGGRGVVGGLVEERDGHQVGHHGAVADRPRVVAVLGEELEEPVPGLPVRRQHPAVVPVEDVADDVDQRRLLGPGVAGRGEVPPQGRCRRRGRLRPRSRSERHHRRVAGPVGAGV